MRALTLAESAERVGDWEEADRLYTDLLQDAQRTGDLQLLADVLRKQARIRLLSGQPDEAEEVALLAWEVSNRLGLPAASARSLNLLALIHHSTGDLEAAEQEYGDALERARAAADDELVGAVCQNLGVLANVRGDLREGRSLYLECVASTVRSGDKTATMAAYNNLGMVCVDLMDWLEAEIFFSRGIEIAEQIGDTVMRTKLYVNRAEPLIHFGSFEQAEETLARAEDLATRIGDHCVLADVARFRGVIARATGDAAEADRLLSAALAVAQEAELVLETGEALEEIARLRWDQGRRGAARATLREAKLCFQQIGAANDLRRLEEVRSDWEDQARPAP